MNSAPRLVGPAVRPMKRLHARFEGGALKKQAITRPEAQADGIRRDTSVRVRIAERSPSACASGECDDFQLLQQLVNGSAAMSDQLRRRRA